MIVINENKKSNSVAMKHIIDTWNIIDKYDVKGWTEDYDNDVVYIPKSEYDRVIKKVRNPNYIKGLRL